jgi:hypothetical protein
LQTWWLNFRLKWLLVHRKISFTIQTYAPFGVYNGTIIFLNSPFLNLPLNFSLRFRYENFEIDAWIHRCEFNGTDMKYSFVAKCADDFQRRVMFDPERHYSVEEILERIQNECLVLKIPASFVKSIWKKMPIQFTTNNFSVQDLLCLLQAYDSEPRYYLLHNTLFKMGIEE